MWGEIKNDWDQRFSKASVKYDVKIKIRDFETTCSKKSENFPFGELVAFLSL